MLDAFGAGVVFYGPTSVAYTCSHYSPTNLWHRGAGSAPGACVVLLLLPGGLFIHLHTVTVDPVTWPGGDSELLGSDPTALKVRWAAGGREEVNDESSSLFFIFLPISSFSSSLSICHFLSHTVSNLHCVPSSSPLSFLNKPFPCFFMLPYLFLLLLLILRRIYNLRPSIFSLSLYANLLAANSIFQPLPPIFPVFISILVLFTHMHTNLLNAHTRHTQNRTFILSPL